MGLSSWPGCDSCFFTRPVHTSHANCAYTQSPGCLMATHLTCCPTSQRSLCPSRGVATAYRGGLRHQPRQVEGGGVWPWRAPSGKISMHSSYSKAVTQLRHIHATVCGSLGVNELPRGWLKSSDCRPSHRLHQTAYHPSHSQPASAGWHLGTSNICIRLQVPGRNPTFVFLLRCRGSKHRSLPTLKRRDITRWSGWENK